MYGKHFSTMYEGSMVGAGSHVFAVWGYCIANADPDAHTVRLNPKLLSSIIGDTEERINEAISYLSSPDKDSQCTDEEGRRLLNTSGMEYLVVSHCHYREIKNGHDRREYMRKYMKKRRECKDVNSLQSLQSLQVFTPVSVCESVSEKEGMQGEIDPHAPVSESTLAEYQGAVSFLKLHPAFKKIQPMAIENTLKGFVAYKQHWPKMLREFQSDNAGVDALKYPPCQALRIAFSRYVKFNNLPSPYQSN
jgi:hypothetical protein